MPLSSEFHSEICHEVHSELCHEVYSELCHKLGSLSGFQSTGSLPPHSFKIALSPSRHSSTDLGGNFLARPAVLPVEERQETAYSSGRDRSSAINYSQSSIS